ncbi:hypothetical protein [Salinisphaera orenii]|uniref:hypothetical protein n=1 Tax=Salinisphaera orenii TaxID=856731 RepID=UPI0011CEBB3C|nr:hypothetical protein [Salinisphaera halophila]|tara:strand:- start:712 stop:1212 length:501 start_codon:yes stop_codon:yes gene_type:complete
MYHPTKTSAFISLLSAGAIALGSVAVASAHISRFEDLSTANGMSGQRISDAALNKPDERRALNKQIPGKTERRAPWNTSIDSASLGHSGSNHGMSPIRGQDAGPRGSDDYDISADRANASNGSIDSSTSGDSISNQGMERGRELPKDDPAHTSPRSHIHAGPHKDQ